MNKRAMPRVVIVADDLTGAADSVARAVQAGLSAEIWLEISQETTNSDVVEVDVIAISTDSRFLPPEEAAQSVAKTLSMLTRRFGTGVAWYKKIDSTLRGNLGAELDAMLAARPTSAAVICPAFPAQGRGLEGGRLVYAGAPPHHLPMLLREQSSSPIGEIGLARVRQGAAALKRALQERCEQGEKLLVVDGLTESDLEIIVAAAQSEEYILCGSAGMVAPLAAQFASKGDDLATAPAQVSPGPLLAVVGSGSATAHAQVAEVAAAEKMRVRALDKSWYEVDLVGAKSHPVGDWLIHLEPPADGMPLDGPVARAQAARLADLAFAAVDRLQPSTLLVVGGDTAYYVLRRLGFERLTVMEELMPGIPLTVGVDRAGCRRAVVLKPGNFGDEQTLVRLHETMQGQQVQR
jgi:D-threonate/D-erythronate kinase